MEKNLIKILLENYPFSNAIEKDYSNRMFELLENEPLCFHRELLKGHFTGSAFIVNYTNTKTLLVHHAKLNRWLQPGGHCDGNPDIAMVALKEAEEETGLKHFLIDRHKIFDIDIHTIPERKGIPEHLHYDVRFLLIADENEPIVVSDESTDIQWVILADIEKFTQESSILRMVNKLGKL
jgi:8-oxo-dGTP pyrophosphatase MutT (NUDIX family)